MRISSAFNAVSLKQEPRPLLVGERLNIMGSARTKKMALAEDYEGLLEIARRQVGDGAHCLDLCMASNDVDEEALLLKLTKSLSSIIAAPLVIDCTDPKLVAKSVMHTPGRPIINSINLENEERFAGMAEIMAKYGVPAVAMCIGTKGMARTSADKLSVAEELFEYGKKWNLREEQYIFDVLTFPITTGTEQDSAMNTFEGIRLVKERFPKASTILGISNVSMSLKPYARRRVNSIFLHHAVKAGLDAAIIDVGSIIPYHTIPQDTVKVVEDVLFNIKPDALEILDAHFSDRKDESLERPDVDPSWPPAERAKFRIINQMPVGIIDDTREAITLLGGGHDSALTVLNDSLLPAMREVGDMFGRGDLILASVLKSAECMKAATTELEKHLDKIEGSTKGTVVLGTVFGDVHDIGKNLAKTILENNGFTVHDLGKQVPLQSFLDAIKEYKADAVGLSALLVHTSKQMKLFVEHARDNNMDLPILCGGAAINSNYINRIANDGGTYGKIFYCNTIFDGLNTMEDLVSDRSATIQKRQDFLENWTERKYDFKPAQASSIKPLAEPPFPGEMTVRTLSVQCSDIWPRIDLKELFKGQWGLIGKAATKKAEAEHYDILEQQKEIAIKLFDPQITYGFFKCRSDGDKLIVNGNHTFDFPRSRGGLCLADYFGSEDCVAFQAVTVGKRVTEALEKLNAENRYTDSYYLTGLSTMSAEALAVYANEMINEEWGIKKSTRYSWGYPSCPDITQHGMVWDLLKPDNMELTDYGQITPEHSTAAIVVHHPESKYFS